MDRITAGITPRAVPVSHVSDTGRVTGSAGYSFPPIHSHGVIRSNEPATRPEQSSWLTDVIFVGSQIVSTRVGTGRMLLPLLWKKVAMRRIKDFAIRPYIGKAGNYPNGQW